MQWIEGPVALRRRLDHLEANRNTRGSPATVSRSANTADALERGVWKLKSRGAAAILITTTA
jgi:hypothetical protein